MMELQLFETNLQLETSQPLNARVLKILVNLNPILAEDEALLLSYYKRVRATWSSSAIKTLQKSTGLKLTNKLNRCQFARAAARFELQFVEPEIDSGNCYLIPESVISELPGRALSDKNPNNFLEFDNHQPEFSQFDATELISPRFETIENPLREELKIARQQILELESQLKEQSLQLKQEKQLLEQSKNFSYLLLTNRLLLPGLPLNGTQESPAMRILGSPTTLTELEANYRELIKREHPDVSPFAEEEAINRFAYLRSQRSDNQRELASIEAHGDDREGGGARLG